MGMTFDGIKIANTKKLRDFNSLFKIKQGSISLSIIIDVPI
jgi:hypothetical protein